MSRVRLRNGERPLINAATLLTESENARLRLIADKNGLCVSDALRLCVETRWSHFEGDTAP